MSQAESDKIPGTPNICEECGKTYVIPEGNWLKNGDIGKGHGSISGKRFCCFGCGQKHSQRKRKGKWKSAFNDPEVRAKARQTIEDKYGTSNVFSSDIIKDRIKTTNLKRYGVDNPSKNKDIQMKIHNTCIQRYGGTGLGSDILAIQIKDTNKRIYGDECPQTTEVVKNRIRKTNLKRRGVEYPMQDQDVKDKSIATCLDRYGYAYNCMNEKARVNSGAYSRLNDDWYKKIKKLGYAVEREKTVEGHYSFDLYIPALNLLIDINPTHSHQSTEIVPHQSGYIRPKDKTYHRDKTLVAMKKGYEVMMIWDWDRPRVILDYLRPKERLDLNECYVEEVLETTATLFLNKYCIYKAYDIDRSIYIGLYYKGYIVAILVFDYNKNKIVGLRYSYSHDIPDADRHLFKYFIDKYNPSYITAYNDYSKNNKGLFERLGFIKDKEIDPICHYSIENTRKHYINNDKIADNHYKKVYDCGGTVYIWTNQVKKELTK